MILQLINSALAFLGESLVLVATMMSIVEYVKRWAATQVWYQGWQMTVFGFVLGFLFALPAAGFAAIDLMVYIPNSVILGLVATGIYKTANSVLRA